MHGPPLSLESSVSIVIPAYNEQHSISTVLDHLQTIMAASGLVYEIIVVDDGSTDSTASAIQQHSGVKLLRHIDNRGYGAALKTGIRYAQNNLIYITDADGTYPNERIPELVERLCSGRCHMVVGARTGTDVHIPPLRRPAKWAISKLANSVAGVAIPDINSGMRIFPRETVLRFFGLLPDGFSFTTTITLGMLLNGYLVEYIPINYHVRVGKSKIKPIRDTLNFIQLILRIGLYFAPLKIFLPASAALLLLALVWGVFSAAVLGRLADVSTLVMVMAAVQIAVVGLLAELINHRLPNIYREE